MGPATENQETEKRETMTTNATTTRTLFLTVLLFLSAMLLAAPVRANATEDLLRDAIVDACRMAHARLATVDPFLPAFDADRVTVHPSGDVVGALDELLDAGALARFAAGSATWFWIIDARHARRVLGAHYS